MWWIFCRNATNISEYLKIASLGLLKKERWGSVFAEPSVKSFLTEEKVNLERDFYIILLDFFSELF